MNTTQTVSVKQFDGSTVTGTTVEVGFVRKGECAGAVRVGSKVWVCKEGKKSHSKHVSARLDQWTEVK